MDSETLIQTTVRMYLSSKINKLTTEAGHTVHGFDNVFKVLKRSFEQREQFFDLLLRSYGGNIRGLDNLGHFIEMLKFWSPCQARSWNGRAEDIDWLRTIEDLCRFSEIAPRQEPEHGFQLDSRYFGVWIFKTMPRATWVKTMEPFFNLTIPNLRVVVNMQPLPVESEIRYEEDRFGKLVSNINPQNPSLQSEVGLDKHRERMRRLMSNQVVPFKAQIIVIAHDKTCDGLDTKMEALRAAIGKTGAEPYRPLLPSSILAFFNCATPGFGPWVSYSDYWHKIDDLNLSNMWPIRSTPKADLDKADWICDGDLNNLIGGSTFIGSQPAHMLIAGTTGSGKSTTMQTLILQSALRFKLIVVIDNGLSYLTTCRLLDPSSHPIIVRSNGNYTFNPFDTRQQLLSPQHLTNATALCHLLVGTSLDEDKNKLRQSILAETINGIYNTAYKKWRNANPEAHFDLCREAALLLKFQEAQMGLSDGFIDAFLVARDLRRVSPEILAEFIDDIHDDEALALDRNPETEYLVRNLAFSMWTPEMFPTLFDLQDELNAIGRRGSYHKETCSTLASLLRPWLRDGRYGPVVDGASNLDFGSEDISENDPLKVLHFELGLIGETEVELKAVVGFLITNEVRNHIMGMPRSIRKQVIIEEMTSFLEIPNGEKIVIDYYERMRKYNCQIVSVFQQYSSLLEAHPKVAKAIIGNSSAMLLLRNQNRKDLDTLGSFIHIPEVIKDKITSFPMPEDMKGKKDAHAAFVWAQLTEANPRFTIGRNYMSDELLYITSSSGDMFERKKKDLQNAKTVLDAVIENASVAT